MASQKNEPVPPASLPPDGVDGLTQLNGKELRAAIDYAEHRR